MTTYILNPKGLLDKSDPRVMRHEGAEVRKVQPVGCPKNGTMRMCYVERVDNGHFIGLVCLSALDKKASTK